VAATIPAVASPGAESHCVLRVIGEQPDGEFVTAPEACFATLSQAMSFASGGTVAFDADLSGADLLANRDGAATLASTFTLGVHFDGFNGTGSSISIVGSSCSGGYWNTGSAWQDRISSSWNGCYRLRHHAQPGAPLDDIYEDTTGTYATHNLSGMNNKTRSVAYFGS